MLDFLRSSPDKDISLHNHSIFSDGASTLEEMVAAAKNAQLKVFGMSDHWVVPPYDGTDYLTWAMPHGKLDEYVDTLLELRKKYEDEKFQLKIGLEVDFFFENISEVIKNLQRYPLDYLIGSVHYSGIFSVDHDIIDWEPLNEAEKAEVCEIYYKKLEGAAASGVFDFIGHLDLPKKFGLIDNEKYLPHALKVLDILAENGGALELNTAGFYKQCSEQYPSLEILKAANIRQIPVYVNSDAHASNHVDRGFAEAYGILKKAGYSI